MDVTVKFERRVGEAQEILEHTSPRDGKEFHFVRPLTSVLIKLDPYEQACLEIKQMEDGEICVIHDDGSGHAPECVFSVMPESL